MSSLKPLDHRRLYKPCDPDAFAFTHTGELSEIEWALGQERAMDALNFGLGVRGEGYNVVAVGPIGCGKYTAINRAVSMLAAGLPPADDWCYVYRFDDPRRPRALRLPSGAGNRFRRDVEVLVKDLCCAVPGAYYSRNSPALQIRLHSAMAEDADQHRLDGLAAAQPVDGEETEQSPEQQFAAVQFVTSQLVYGLEQRYKGYPDAVGWLAELRGHIREHLAEMVDLGKTEEERFSYMNRFRVMVLVDNRLNQGAPLVHESVPTMRNLVGQIETAANRQSDYNGFELLQAGALHRANGGFLLLDAHKIWQDKHAWEALKSALRGKVVVMEESERRSSTWISPDAIPLNIKVVLYGDRQGFDEMCAGDREFLELFKVTAEFELAMPRNAQTEARYAQLLAGISKREELRALSGPAVARVIEQSARMVGDAEKLTTHQRSIRDLIRESDYWAEQRGQEVIEVEDVQRALDEQVHRADRMRHWTYEDIERGFLLIDTLGEAVGTVNGLLVYQQNSFPYAKPSRITATVRPGRGRIVDIERETRLGGALHSKGVLILASLLGSRYTPDTPLSIVASLVFEQSYGPIDGDSASLAELCAILSALARVPVAQQFAMTGSVNQHGRVQFIGGVNVKIEGFYDVCRAQGLTGHQGVLIPAANIKHLMLRHDVAAAARAGEFHIYPIETVDEAVTLLTGRDAGVADDDGRFPAGSVNARVAERLTAFAATCLPA